MRTYDQILAEMQIRKALGMPRIELSPAEKARAFGDAEYRQLPGRAESLIERLKAGLPLSISDRREAKRLLKQEAA
jgi:hypothetical protein